MEQKNYETVFILTPVLSESQLKDSVGKYKKIIKDNGADIIYDENWGMKKLAYPIQHKSSGFYQLFQYKAPSKIVSALNTEFRRDDKILRSLTVSLDKYALEFNEKRSKGLLISQKPKKENKELDSPPLSAEKPGKIPDKLGSEAISQDKQPKLPKESQDKPEGKEKIQVPAGEVKEIVEKPETVKNVTS